MFYDFSTVKIAVDNLKINYEDEIVFDSTVVLT
jgi:hypothetical protein